MPDFKHPIYGNNGLREMTPEEVKFYADQQTEAERTYWTQPYNVLVDTEVRKRYPLSDELAILRQQTTKPDEYAVYFAYCEDCKAFVKEQMAKYR